MTKYINSDSHNKFYYLKIMKKLIIILFLSANMLLYSQQRTLYNIPNIQQSTLLNPAIQHKCKLFVGLPVISSTLFNFNHTAFSYNDVFKPAGNGQYTINIAKLEKRVHPWNYLKTQLNVNLLALGFKYEDYYFSFDLSNKTDFKFGYPDDYIKIVHGNGYFMGKNYLELAPFLTAVNYNEMAFGVSEKLSKRLTIGGKFKLLKGVANAQITNSYARLYTDENTYDLLAKAKIKINASFPVTIQYDTLNLPTEASLNEINVMQDFVFNKNTGAAADFGFIYRYSKEITLSGSILDLGFIRWASNTNSLQGNGEFKFTGFDIGSWFNFSMLKGHFNYDSLRNVIKNKYIDSLQNAYNLSHNNSPYFSLLHPKIYLGGTYQALPYLNFGAVTRISIYNRRIYPTLTLSANGNFWQDRIQASLSYSLMNNTFRNLGFGLAFRLGPVQLYTVSDNFLMLFDLRRNRSFSLHFGMNLMFGCNERNKRNRNFNPYKHHRRKANYKDLCPAYQ